MFWSQSEARNPSFPFLANSTPHLWPGSERVLHISSGRWWDDLEETKVMSPPTERETSQPEYGLSEHWRCIAGFETLIKLWQQEHGLKVFDSRKLRGICGPKAEGNRRIGTLVINVIISRQSQWSDYVSSNGKTMNERWIRKDWGGSISGLMDCYLGINLKDWANQENHQ